MSNCKYYDKCVNHSQCENCIDYDKFLGNGDIEKIIIDVSYYSQYIEKGVVKK